MERIAEPGNGNDDDLDRIERCASPLSMDVERGKLKLQLLKVPFIYYVSTFLGFLSPPQCVELKLRWQFCVHTRSCHEIYF